MPYLVSCKGMATFGGGRDGVWTTILVSVLASVGFGFGCYPMLSGTRQPRCSEAWILALVDPVQKRARVCRLFKTP
jgi:hypothetical protein